MILRKTSLSDVDAVLEIIDFGKDYLKSQGIDQWQQGYPNRQSILDDIQNGEGYVLEMNGEIVGTAMLSFGGEPTYENLEGGQWLASEPYGVLHRVAVLPKFKGQGLGLSLIEQAGELCLKRGVYSLRVDTHQENKSMQNLLTKAGFSPCGIIHLNPYEKGEQGTRAAYEKLLSGGEGQDGQIQET